jgi:hypothetical protein
MPHPVSPLANPSVKRERSGMKYTNTASNTQLLDAPLPDDTTLRPHGQTQAASEKGLPTTPLDPLHAQHGLFVQQFSPVKKDPKEP